MRHPSEGLGPYFVNDHRSCDAHWVLLEESLESGAATEPHWQAFDAAMRRHMAMEEDVLFPAFEQATGMLGGPTVVMRAEHERMRAMLTQMATLARAGEWEALADQGDTLMMLIGQHNAKEEAMLYPMAERALGHAWAPIAAKLADY
jgi:hemerythrin-like domain-containing protein